MSLSTFLFFEIYQRFFKYIEHNLKYINDFFNLSTIRHKISTYRHETTMLRSTIIVREIIIEEKYMKPTSHSI
ncbi:hypothetical protein BPADB04_27080 [Bacillus paranthracis]|uniref:Uncharacterized protein n=1 Tax=Bacillus paranthracis TaxID=2026186 RepID=A0A9X8SFC7_9BACI|nr:hypothetical protein BG06_1425 [Bacillus thuringiensis]GIX57678.1 hypothetical protein BPADB04_27080 [Bacillus paranthracis]SME10166.1 hypothetical protein BACERE00221_02669 [Bacillus paranthracis]